MRNLIILLAIILIAGCKKDNPSPNISGDYTVNCVRTTDSTYFSGLEWRVVHFEGATYYINTNDSIPFYNLAIRLQGQIKISTSEWHGQGTYGEKGMWIQFDNRPREPKEEWTCTCIKTN